MDLMGSFCKKSWGGKIKIKINYMENTDKILMCVINVIDYIFFFFFLLGVTINNISLIKIRQNVTTLFTTTCNYSCL
jgi:hypothetical protein